MENNNKESFKLLGMSASGSDSGSIPEFIVTPRKKKVKRRVRSSPSRIRQTESCTCKGRTVTLSLGVTLLLCWLIVLTWLAVVLHSELKRLDTKVHSVVAGSQDVPEALQKCHSLSKELQQNQTEIFKRLDTVTAQLGNFSGQLMGVQHGLHEVEDKLKAAPELVNIPQNLKELSASIASFGSHIKDLDATVSSLKNQNYQLQETSKILIQNVTSVKQTVFQLLNTSQQPEGTGKESSEEKEAMLTFITQLSQNVSSVNDTLHKNLQWLQDDEKRDHKNVENLQELGQNVSARVTTLEGECAKTSMQTTLISQVGNLTEQMGNNEVQLHDLVNRLRQLENNSSQIVSALNDLHEAVSKLRSHYFENSQLIQPTRKNISPQDSTPDPTK